ncbi:ABC transporter [Pelomyxa schiedti]|nr:ABC transporter [Pelomyxa schiedti]
MKVSDCKAAFRRILTRASVWQWVVVSHKNILMSLRNWKTTVTQILSPAIIMMFLLIFQVICDTLLMFTMYSPAAVPVGKIPMCTPAGGHFIVTETLGGSQGQCTTLLYSPQGVAWVDDVMLALAQDNGLVYGEDILSMGGDDHSMFGLLADNQTLYTYILDHQNQTQNAILFTSAYGLDLNDSDPNVPQQSGYLLFFNETYSDNNGYYTPALNVMRSLDEILLRKKTDSAASITVGVAPAPQPEPRFPSFDVVASFGGVWFYLPPMITFFMVLNEIVMEKESRIRLGMSMMGMKNWVYWLTWFGVGTFFMAVMTLVLQFSGMACLFDFFTNSNFFAVFLLFFLFGLSFVCIAFMLASVLSRTQTAQTVGYALILIGFVLQSIICAGYGMLIALLYNPSHAWITVIRVIFQLYPPFNLAKAYSDIAALSSETINMAQGTMVQGPGFHWSDLYVPRVIEGNPPYYPDMTVPPPINSYYALLIDSVIFLLLCWYFDNILPGEKGSPQRPLYFFLTKDYWMGNKNKKVEAHSPSATTIKPMDVSAINSDVLQVSEEEDSDVMREESLAASVEDEENASSHKYTVIMKNLAKSFTSYHGFSKKYVRAVDGVTLCIEEGTIFCILGVNGAGKTTLLSILTGIYPPTGGYSTVLGFDVKHNILWSELTAYEHLSIFARLKGITAVKEEVEARLDEVGLLSVAGDRAGTFSGGMKRRLAVAMSLVGDPRIVMMDEPSTGMDLVNRQKMWECIQSLKKNRTIILTTHSMEEAEVLGDRIGIMARGRYGTGYHVSIVNNCKDNVVKQETISRVTECVGKDAILSSDEGGNMVFTIPPQCVPLLPNLIALLVQLASSGVVQEWGVSQSSLEDVFLSISKKYPAEKDEEGLSAPHETQTATATGASDNKYTVPATPSRLSRYLSMTRALVLKNASLQLRQKGTNICQIITPIFVLLTMLLIQLILQSQLGSNASSEIYMKTAPFPLNTDLSHIGSLREIHSDHDIEFTSFLEDSAPSDGGCLLFFLFEDTFSSVPAGVLPEYNSSQKSGLIGNIKQHQCILDNGTVVLAPYFLPRENASVIDKEFADDFEVYNKAPITNVTTPPMWYLAPDGSVKFHAINIDLHQLNYTLAVNDHAIIAYHRPNNFTRLDINATAEELEVDISYLSIIVQGRFALMSMIDDAFTAMITNTTPTTSWSFREAKWVQAMPYFKYADSMALLEAVGTVLYPLALVLQLPIYIYILVMEKEEQLLSLMQVHGLQKPFYVIVNSVFFFFFYSVSVAFFWITGAFLDIRLFSQTSPGTLIVFFLGWGMALIAFAFFVASFLTSKRAATIVGYLIALLGTIIGFMIVAYVYGVFTWSVSHRMPPGLLLVPQIALIRGIFLMNAACALLYQCYGPLTDMPFENEMSNVLISLFVDTILYFILALYLEAVLPQGTGVPSHPLFFLQPIVDRIKKLRNKKTHASHEYSSLPTTLPSSMEPIADIDAQEEQNKVATGYYHDSPLVISALSKSFPPKSGSNKPYQAVKNLSLGVCAGECLGLLGENGAGKTTTISMLTGTLKPTSGTAFVAGKWDITKDLMEIHSLIGVCPQFSILWEELTCREILLFFARLKGVQRKIEKAVVTECLDRFRLLPVATRLVKNLSGGMKRRLSVGIAVIGDPKIVFLDEPTTGLDPASRRVLWEAIASARQGRAMILTTHSMEEAETLCNKIAIMSKGTLQCIGSPLHLKNKYDKGYRLTINFSEEDAERAHEFIMTLIPSVEETPKTFRGVRVYKLQSPDEELTNVFRLMMTRHDHERENLITDWSIGQIGLGDVFQHIVEQSHTAPTEKP